MAYINGKKILSVIKTNYLSEAERDLIARYHLGAYDRVATENGVTTITRQTGYVDLGSLSWYGDGNPYYQTDDLIPYIAKPSSDNVVADMVCSNPNYNIVARNLTDNTNDMACASTGTINIRTSTKPSGILQYKLATPYQEQIIEGQPLNTLDQKGSQWLRNEWEKGLNLFDNALLPKVDYTASGNTFADFRIELWTTPNTSGTQISFFNSYDTFTRTIASGNYYFRVGLNGDNQDDKYFITTPIYLDSGTYTIGFDLELDEPNHYIVKSIMLNKGSHAYHYQEYNGKIVRSGEVPISLTTDNNPPTQNGYWEALGSVVVGSNTLYAWRRL